MQQPLSYGFLQVFRPFWHLSHLISFVKTPFPFFLQVRAFCQVFLNSSHHIISLVTLDVLSVVLLFPPSKVLI
jgi:hypothetical protein